MNGFKIICLDCGKEIVLTQDSMSSDTDISIYNASYDGDIKIVCDCGNTVED